MAPPSTTTPSSGLAAAILSLDWVDHVLLGKAKKGRVPSVLLEDGFIRAVLREANLLKKEVAIVAGGKQFRKRMLKASGIDWRKANVKERNKAITELSKLIRGMPSQFAPGVEVVLDEQGGLVVDDTHRELGKKFTTLKVDPVFSLRNEEAITAIRGTTSIFFPSEYEAQAVRFRRRAQDTIASGLEEGLGRREIASELREEFSEAALHESYWETVAAVHVNRARSFSSASTYAGAGVTKYEVLSVLDERTTKVCRMMDGKILSVESALGSFDAFEGARSLVEVRERTNPFMRVRGDGIFLPDGTRTATIGPKGGFSNTLTPTQLNGAGVNMPPYHFRCRTTVVPVMATAPPPPKPKSIKPSEAPKPPKKKPPRKKPKKPVPEGVEPDPPVAATTPAGRRKAILDQIKDGRGFVPGSLVKTNDLFGKPGTDPAARERAMDKLNSEMAELFRERGRALLATNPKTLEKWNTGLRNRGVKSSRVSTRLAARSRQEAAGRAALDRGKKIGLEAIPEKDRNKRRKKFLQDLKKKAVQGTKRAGTFRAKPAHLRALERRDEEDLEVWGTQFFDAHGPVAEAALARNSKAFRTSFRDRVHNSQFNKYFAYKSRKSFHHELAHSVEHHVNHPRGKGARSNKSAGEDQSFWRRRVETRDRSPARRLKDVIPGSTYDDWEKTKEDKWAKPYMGKTYARGSTEVVAMLSEGYGGHKTLWGQQFKDDPDVLLEYLGYQESIARGEETLRSRRKAALKEKKRKKKTESK